MHKTIGPPWVDMAPKSRRYSTTHSVSQRNAVVTGPCWKHLLRPLIFDSLFTTTLSHLYFQPRERIMDTSHTMAANITSDLPHEGDRVQIYWSHDDDYYAGHIQQVYPDSTFALIAYDDGERETLDLAIEIWRHESKKQKGRQSGASAVSAAPSSRNTARKNSVQVTKVISKSSAAKIQPLCSNNQALSEQILSSLQESNYPNRLANLVAPSPTCITAEHSSTLKQPCSKKRKITDTRSLNNSEIESFADANARKCSKDISHTQPMFTTLPTTNPPKTVSICSPIQELMQKPFRAARKPGSIPLPVKLATNWLQDESRRPSSPVESEIRDPWAHICAELCLTYVHDGLEMNETVPVQYEMCTWWKDPSSLNQRSAFLESWNKTKPLTNDEVFTERAIVSLVTRKLSQQFDL